MEDLNIIPLSEISQKLKSRRLYIVAEETGVSYPTLKKLADNVEANYRLDTLQKISDFLRDKTI